MTLQGEIILVWRLRQARKSLLCNGKALPSHGLQLLSKTRAATGSGRADAVTGTRAARAQERACRCQALACRLPRPWCCAMARRCPANALLRRRRVQVVGQAQQLQERQRLRAARRGPRHAPGRAPPAGPGRRALEVVGHGCAAARCQRRAHMRHVRLASAAPVPTHACARQQAWLSACWQGWGAAGRGCTAVRLAERADASPASWARPPHLHMPALAATVAPLREAEPTHACPPAALVFTRALSAGLQWPAGANETHTYGWRNPADLVKRASLPGPLEVMQQSMRVHRQGNRQHGQQ